GRRHCRRGGRERYPDATLGIRRAARFGGRHPRRARPSGLLTRTDDRMHPERLLLGPGASNPFPEVMEAFQRPVLGHLDPDFLVVLDQIADRLRVAFRTSNTLTLPISGTGSAGMEACFVNLLEPGDTAII